MRAAARTAARTATRALCKCGAWGGKHLQAYTQAVGFSGSMRAVPGQCCKHLEEEIFWKGGICFLEAAGSGHVLTLPIVHSTCMHGPCMHVTSGACNCLMHWLTTAKHRAATPTTLGSWVFIACHQPPSLKGCTATLRCGSSVRPCGISMGLVVSLGSSGERAWASRWLKAWHAAASAPEPRAGTKGWHRERRRWLVCGRIKDDARAALYGFAAAGRKGAPLPSSMVDIAWTD